VATVNERWVCKRCYADNNDTDMTCSRCGLSRGADVATADAAAWQQQQQAGQPVAQGRSWAQGLLRFAWIPVLAVVLGVGYFASQGERDLENLAAGDCFDAADEDEISEIDKSDCGEPHEFEAFHVVTLDGDTFPPDAEMENVLLNDCLPAFDGYVGEPYQTSALFATMITPSSASWADGDRVVVCVLYDPEDTELTSSMRDSGR